MSDQEHKEQTEAMKDRVRERYGSIAERFSGADESRRLAVMAEVTPEAGQLYKVADGVSCCGSDTGTDCCSPDGNTGTGLAGALYAGADLGDLPETVTGASLGCGNPTAIANLQPGEVVLDLGSGGGIDCFLAAKAVGPAGYVIGVDMTDSMLALANQNKAKMDLTNVEFRKGEIEDLPVDSASVDVIISNCVINLAPDKDAVFTEAFRVLKPGGRFTVSDMVTEGEFPEQLQRNVNAWAGCVSGALNQDLYLDKLRRAGFTQVEVESRVSYGIEQPDALDEESRAAIEKDIDWSTVPDDVRLYSARIVAYKPG